MKACPSRQQLEQLLSDSLSEADEKRLDAHVQSCTSCLKTLEELTAAVSSPSKVFQNKAQPATLGIPGPSDALLWRLIAGSAQNDPPTRVVTGRHRPVSPEHKAPQIEGYEILGKLGHGGMGIVYKARQLDLQRIVALKMVLAGVHADPQSLARFHAEAEAVAQLQHPNIVQIYVVGEADGLPYFSLELVDGGTLAQQISGAPVPTRRAAELVEVLARAVQYAHARGIVHRDLKPANVLLTLEGVPKIADFGLAKRSTSEGSAPTTELGLAAGTPRYMAPEQLSPVADGKKRQVGPSSDIYALGAILYELLTGRPLYTGDSPLDVAVRVLHDDPAPPHIYRPEVPRDLENISLKCLAKSPKNRYATARELAEDLERYLLGQPVHAQPPSFFYRSSKFIRRNKVLVGAALAVALALTTGIVAASISAIRESHLRVLADSNAAQAESAREDALLEAYQARLAAAMAALSDHNVGEAAAQLNAVVEKRRGWEWYYAAGRLDDSVSAIHQLGKYMAPYLGGTRIAAVTKEGIRLWDTNSEKPITDIACEAPINIEGLDIAPDSSFLVSYHQGDILHLSKTGQKLQRFASPNPSRMHVVACDQAGTLLARATRYDKTSAEVLDLFDLSTGKLLRSCANVSAELRSLAFHPDGRLLAGGGDDRLVQIWDTRSGAVVRVLHGHRGFVYKVVFSPDGRRLLSSSADGTFRQWDVETGKLLDERYGHDGPVNVAVYSSDGAWIISGGADGAVRYWSAAAGAARTVLRGHATPVTQIMVSPDGQQVISTSIAGSARVFDGPEREDALVLRGHTSFVYPVAYSPDGRLLASGAWDREIRLWDAATGLPLAVLSGNEHYVASLIFSPDSRRLVSRGGDNTIRIWDLSTNKAMAVISHKHTGMADTPHLVAITPDGKRVACPGDNRLSYWNLEDGQEVGTLPLPGRYLRMAVFRPDGKQIACTGDGYDIYLADATTGELQATLRGHTERVNTVSYSPDGSHLVSGADDHDVRLWDTANGECLHIMRRHTGVVFAAVFHPDGTRIASGGRDRTIRIWDVASGVELSRLHGHRDYIFSLQFSPDGASLASGSGDYTARLWDTFPVAQRLQKRALLQKLNR